MGVGPMDKLPGDVWHATGHLDWVLLATLALGFGVQKWARVPILKGPENAQICQYHGMWAHRGCLGGR